jgi:hypothetical protein
MPTLDLTDDEADAVRCALSVFADRMGQCYRATQHPDYDDQERLCDAVVEKLNRAEGRTDG